MVIIFQYTGVITVFDCRKPGFDEKWDEVLCPFCKLQPTRVINSWAEDHVQSRPDIAPGKEQPLPPQNLKVRFLLESQENESFIYRPPTALSRTKIKTPSKSSTSSGFRVQKNQ